MTGRKHADIAIIAGLSAAFWLLVLLLVGHLRFANDLRGFLFLGSDFSHPPALAGIPPYGEQGYDGQFYAALATDPFISRHETVRSLDTPSYRGSHLLAPLLAYLTAFGQPAAAIRTYQGLVWLGALAAVVLAAALLKREGRSPWWALLLVPNAGLAASIMRSTPDGLALALALASLWFYAQGRRRLALLTITLATLTREIYLVGALAYAWQELREGRRQGAASFAGWPLGLLVAISTWLHITVAPLTPLGGSLGIPFRWVMQKFDQMLAANIKFTSIELWGFVALVAVLLSLSGYNRREERLAIEDWTYLAFMALSWTLSFAVYVDVYGYTRALMILPFLAVVLAARQEDLGKRLVLLSVPAMFAFVGLLMVRAEIKAALLLFRG
ncbi:MAG: hypothetical protein V1750_00260 [Acidobacteriota bacterium]